jgi:rRNA-processing protein FCF1
MTWKFQLVWLMHMKITIVFVKLVFRRFEGFKMEQRAAIKFCVKLKKKATETFEILKNVYGGDKSILILC